VEKSGSIDFGKWFNNSFGERTPWGEQDSPAVVAAVESALERSLSSAIMSGGAKPTIRTISEGESLVRQGEAGTEVFLILDGIFVVEVDDKQVAEIGPGAVVGERAGLLNGKRTATLWARTAGRVASVPPDAPARRQPHTHQREQCRRQGLDEEGSRRRGSTTGREADRTSRSMIRDDGERKACPGRAPASCGRGGPAQGLPAAGRRHVVHDGMTGTSTVTAATAWPRERAGDRAGPPHVTRWVTRPNEAPHHRPITRRRDHDQPTAPAATPPARGARHRGRPAVRLAGVITRLAERLAATVTEPARTPRPRHGGRRPHLTALRHASVPGRRS
jgi:hypothetical protein